MTLEVDVKKWNELTPSAYYANWSEKALKVNKDIGYLSTRDENGSHMWTICVRKGCNARIKFGFSENGEICTRVITRKYKDPQKKLFSRSEVEEIMLDVVNAVGAFYKAGILIAVDDLKTAMEVTVNDP